MSGIQYARYIKERNLFFGMGDYCSVSPRANITDPAYLRMGNNVRLSDCHLFGHDGSINMINRAFGTTFDSVGKIDIGNNVYVGHGAMIMPGVIIGNDVIVAAGSVVTKNLEGGFVYGGVPAKQLGTILEHRNRLAEKNSYYPWRGIIEGRAGEFDPSIEAELRKQRVAFFYPDEN